ncbi:MAG: P-loop NTPase, partial [Clostridia bacterium]|nr:P-loop NTPase [Clostridia bacterium]
MARGPRVVAVTGGKGGVGKSTFALNLALAWAQDDRRVVLVDADLGLGTIEVMVDRTPERHLGDWLAGEAGLDEVSLPLTRGAELLASGSGQFALASLSGEEVAEALARIRDWARG